MAPQGTSHMGNILPGQNWSWKMDKCFRGKEQGIPGTSRVARAGLGLWGACTVGIALEGMQEDRRAETHPRSALDLSYFALRPLRSRHLASSQSTWAGAHGVLATSILDMSDVMNVSE